MSGLKGPLDKVAERYFNDPAFYNVVNLLEQMIIDLELSPHEVREAAMYACMRVEIRYPKAMLIGPGLLTGLPGPPYR